MYPIKYLLLLFCALLLCIACQEDEQPTPLPEEVATFDETPYPLAYGALPAPDLPPDNPLTIAGVELGRLLFYDRMLSEDLSRACADCHKQHFGFADSLRFSVGVDEAVGRRQSMPIFNMAWHRNGFLWDGRASLLREQVLLSIQSPLEMNETLDHAISKMNTSKLYKDQFIRAYGSEEITEEKIGLALEQFMLSIVSHQSEYDQYLAGLTTLSASEERGRLLFERPYQPATPEMSGANCIQCHSGPNFENSQYVNNGLDTDAAVSDAGRQNFTQDPADRAKFKVPSLRNIAITAPYMHDGRFANLAQVIDHYDSGIRSSATLDSSLLSTQASGLQLSQQDKTDLLNFLHTLTDEHFLENVAYESPF